MPPRAVIVCAASVVPGQDMIMWMVDERATSPRVSKSGPTDAVIWRVRGDAMPWAIIKRTARFAGGEDVGDAMKYKEQTSHASCTGYLDSSCPKDSEPSNTNNGYYNI